MLLSQTRVNQLTKLYNDRINFLLDYRQFGRRVRYLYSPTCTTCDNCYQNASGMSAGLYKPGGAVPFEGTCPVCLGKGTFEESVTEEDVLIVLFDSNMWFEPSQVAKLPDNSAMIIGDRLKSWNKVAKAPRIILNLDVYGENTTYRLYSKLYPVGLFNSNDRSGSRWFYAFLTQEKG